MLVEAGRKDGDGLPKDATGAALMCYAAGKDESEAVNETVAILKQADISVLSFTRGDRAATVQIEKRTLGGSTTTITVAPRQSGPPPGTGASAPVQVTPAR